MKYLIIIYVIGCIASFINFCSMVKNQGSDENFITIMLYVLGKKEHYKYTLRSWLYFLNI